MARKKKQDEPTLKQYPLPATEEDLRKFINVNIIDMMEHAVDSIQYALDNNLPMVEIYQFQSSEFVIILSNKDFLSNLEHIYNYYISHEKYEFCGRVVDLRKQLGNKLKLNET